MKATPEIIIEAVKRISIEAVAGGRFSGSAVRVGPCPLCMKGAKKGSCFKIRDGVRWHCHRCDKGGDVVALEAELAGVGQVEAAKRLLGGLWQERLDAPALDATPRRQSDSAAEAAARKARYAAEIWRGGVAFAGSPAEAYLAGRGIEAAVLAAIGPNLRFNPRARWFWDPAAKGWETAPAMVALVVVAGPDGRPVATGGVHGTYLLPDGSGKAVDTRPIPPEDRANAKVMWGPQGLDGQAGGTWLIGPDAPWLEGLGSQGGPGAVGAEGIETSASMASLSLLRHGVVPRAWAALSLDRLQGRLATDDDGCVDLKTLTARPGSAFVWPGIVGNEIGIDRDMALLRGVRTRVGRPRGRSGLARPCEVQLDGETRARICARMSVAAWRTAGDARATAIAPPPGMDFNDYLRRHQARAEASA
jgi:hypothetical protein